MSAMALTFSSLGLYAKLFGVIAAIILFGAWLLEKTAVDHATKLRDGIAKAEQDKEVTERTFRIESRLIEVYQVAASARDYSYRCTLKAKPTYIDELTQDVELLERTGVARDLTSAMLGYSSRTNSFLEAINPPASLRDRVAKATQGVVDFKTQIDKRRGQYNAGQQSLVGQVINPNTITESQASQLSASIRAFRNDIEFSMMPLWCAKIPSGSHLTETLALICSASLARRPEKPAPPGRKLFSAGLTVCHPDSPCLDSFRTQSAHWILCIT